MEWLQFVYPMVFTADPSIFTVGIHSCVNTLCTKLSSRKRPCVCLLALHYKNSERVIIKRLNIQKCKQSRRNSLPTCYPTASGFKGSNVIITSCLLASPTEVHLPGHGRAWCRFSIWPSCWLLASKFSLFYVLCSLVTVLTIGLFICSPHLV